MNKLSEDPNFHYEALRSLGLARYGGSDVAEQLAILPKIKPGDPESWYEEWEALAQRVLSSANEDNGKIPMSPTSLCDMYFRASHYFFVADFFIHGNQADPRLRQSFDLWRKYFDKANALLPVPGQHAVVKTGNGFDVPIIIYQAPPQATVVAAGSSSSQSPPRPTLLVGGGFDSNYEETYHAFAVPALDRGYNVIIYEGPGQPSLLHTQKVGFIAEWEKVVSPILDYIEEQQAKSQLSFIDFKKIGLIGWSLGGYLSARAAAFEPRLAAVMCIDGVWSFQDCIGQIFPDAMAAFRRGDREACDAAFEKDYTQNTNRRWFHDHAKFSFQRQSAFEILQITDKMSLDGGIAEKIKIPALIAEALDDIFFAGQPERVAQTIGANAYLVSFGDKHAASAHCHSGAFSYANAKIMDWFGHVTR
ncbi:hypothetical protein PFICI_03592 [Pestalotiopsis fici W106-1]|uniref:AB hydrolase-1 domain-containing protein n=1 Tax=Pestalotiopsis fici (strain W106-1 / CGMCC3.15140) TaxID=1229662 RepID=W3XJD3_PESFW|nr:uncharacterized protein PFICI_03592 [Pestalotiopsis fici W106-1]ETS85567.1 hypothetical protein PFICI_03592 [Pestalotiopsis fici W106-1]